MPCWGLPWRGLCWRGYRCVLRPRRARNNRLVHRLVRWLRPRLVPWLVTRPMRWIVYRHVRRLVPRRPTSRRRPSRHGEGLSESFFVCLLSERWVRSETSWRHLQKRWVVLRRRGRLPHCRWRLRLPVGAGGCGCGCGCCRRCGSHRKWNWEAIGWRKAAREEKLVHETAGIGSAALAIQEDPLELANQRLVLAHGSMKGSSMQTGQTPHWGTFQVK